MLPTVHHSISGTARSFVVRGQMLCLSVDDAVVLVGGSREGGDSFEDIQVAADAVAEVELPWAEQSHQLAERWVLHNEPVRVEVIENLRGPVFVSVSDSENRYVFQS